MLRYMKTNAPTIVIAVIALLFFGYSMHTALQKTLGPFDNVPVKYRWTDSKSGDAMCVAKAPKSPPMRCSQVSQKELRTYKVLYEKPSAVLAEVYRREE